MTNKKVREEIINEFSRALDEKAKASRVGFNDADWEELCVEFTMKKISQTTNSTLDKAIERLEKMKVTTPAGKCPQCHTKTVFGRGHFNEADEHYLTFNYGIDQAIKELEQLKDE